MTPSTRFFLWLSLIKNVGPKTLHIIYNYEKTLPHTESLNPSDIPHFLPLLRAYRGFEDPEVATLLIKAFQAVEKIENEGNKLGIKTISVADSAFPHGLAGATNPPFLLHLWGSEGLLTQPNIGIVGTQQASSFLAENFSTVLEPIASSGLGVISGLAIGCDALAHRWALKNKVPTIAILAHGLDQCYPTQHTRLKQEILNSGGLLVSEYPWGEKAQRNRFVERNRIQAGLSKFLLVLESGIKGGTMHTVAFAKRQRLPIYAMAIHEGSHFETLEQYQGNVAMVKSGIAKRISSAEDLEKAIRYILKRTSFNLRSSW